MSGSSMVTFLILLLLGFIGFVIYFIFKILQFVLVSVNLYKKMVNRQDAMIKLLMDVRDNTKEFNAVNDSSTASDSMHISSGGDNPTSVASDCPHCGYMMFSSERKRGTCPKCSKAL